MKNTKSKKGITLVALIITIIILLILAGVAISQLTDSGLFGKSKLAKGKQENAQELENSLLGDYENQIDILTGRSEPKLDYSLNEQDTGIKWIDGKTIYRRVFHKTMNSTISSGSETELATMTDLDIIIKGFVLTTGNSGGNIEMNNNFMVRYFANQQKLKVQALGNYSGVTRMDVIVEYTKK